MTKHIRQLLDSLSDLLGTQVISMEPVAGGDISRSYKVETSVGNYFLKTDNESNAKVRFKRELEGLRYLASHGVCVPGNVRLLKLEFGVALIMDYMAVSRAGRDFWPNAGKMLAMLHKNNSSHFGFGHDNFIGRLDQSNKLYDTWNDFYRLCRIFPQTRLAVDNGVLDSEDLRRIEAFCDDAHSEYPREEPSLLHGDLWGGNLLCTKNSIPVLIDPAVYYGHREMDLAMTRLFGGFPPEFYHAYNESFPLANGWESRLKYGQLYYLLVHLNLFGSSYLGSVRRIINS